METIINLILAGVILICAWSGYKKGIIMGVGGILAIIVSLYGANLLANTFSMDIIPAIRPFASGFIEGQIKAEDGVSERMGWSGADLSVSDLLAKYPERELEFCSQCYQSLGLDETTSNNMAASTMENILETDASTVDAVVQTLCEKVSYVGCFILAFLLIIIILTVIGNLPNLSYKLPNLDALNDIGGSLLGVGTGIMFCMVIVWALKFTGKIIGSDTLSSAWLASIFLDHNILTHYLGL